MAWDFRGANIDRSAIGPRARVDNRGSSGAVHELRAELDRIRTAVISSDVRPEVRVEVLRPLDELDRAAAAPEPDRTLIARSWDGLRHALTAYLPTVANLAQVAGLVNDLIS